MSSGDVVGEVKAADIEKDVVIARKTLKKIIVGCCSGLDMSYALADCIKLVASTDFITKKLACWFVQNAVGSEQLALLTINTLTRDRQDPNPLIRRLALHTVRSLNCPAVSEHTLLTVQNLLNDVDPYVRRSAVLSWMALATDGTDVVNQLYSMLRDNDPIVVCNCLITLDHILQQEGGVVINRNIACHLLNQIHSFNEFQLVHILKYLAKYQPTKEQDVIDILNNLDPLITNVKSTPVSIQLIQYGLSLVTACGLSHLRQDIILRARPGLLSGIRSDEPETTYAIIDFIASHLLPEFQEVFQSADVCKQLLCCYNDPVYLKLIKMQVLGSIACQQTVAKLVKEVSSYCNSSNPKVCCAAIEVLGELVERFPDAKSECCSMFASTLNVTDNEELLTAVLTVLGKMNLRDCEDSKRVIESVISCQSKLKLDHSICVILGLLIEHQDVVPDITYVVEQLVDKISVPSSELVFLVVKLFIRRPSDSQHLLGRVMQWSSTVDDVLTRDTVRFYYQLLSSDSADLQLARRIFMNS